MGGRVSGREGGGKETQNLVLRIFKNLYLSFYTCCAVLCPTSIGTYPTCRTVSAK